MRVLVVDDDPDLSLLMEIFLTRRGHEVLLASDGRDGLDVLGREGVDLVVLDWMMPTLDGIAMTRAIRADPRVRHLPLLMVTARHDHGEAVAAGVDEVLGKPFTGTVLVATVEDLGGRSLPTGASA
ncbi:MAG: response regulator [Actinobacteria bacterium]|uniref:Unannotated protein n=1 Tax=freshwater metagenome TaxID=449393 RepID=A0A6J6NNR8_9ZZZZ|nr:response regulator [Actinomycetota bacterium]